MDEVHPDAEVVLSYQISDAAVITDDEFRDLVSATLDGWRPPSRRIPVPST